MAHSAYSGEWTLMFRTTRYPELNQTVTLAAGMITDLGDIRLEEAIPVEVLVREPAGLQDSVQVQESGVGLGPVRVVAFLRGGSRWRWLSVESGHVILPPLGAGSYRLEITGENTVTEVREFELVVGRDTNLEIDLQPGVVRLVRVDLPEGTDLSLLTFTTFDGSGRELVSWRSFSTPDRSFAFRPEAVRLVVISRDGEQGEATLGAAKDIRLVLR